MVALAGASACRQPNPEWQGPAEGTGESSHGDVSPDDGPSGSEDADTGPSPEQCAPEPALGEGECPAACDGCDGGRCSITCGATVCQDGSISCPDDWPCDVVCNGKDACKNAAIECGSDRDCTVECQGESACEDAVVTCGSGTCTVVCGPQADACDTLDVECDTTVTCASPSNVGVDASNDSPCACETVDCDG
jgi:hypothetical protein